MKKVIYALTVMLVCGVLSADVMTMSEIRVSGQTTKIEDINNAGQMAGSFGSTSNAFKIDGATTYYLYAGTGTRSGGAKAINATGEVAGYGYASETGYKRKPVLWTSFGSGANVGTVLTATASDATQIAFAVGSSNVGGYAYNGVVKNATIWDYNGNQVYTHSASGANYVDASQNNVFVGTYIDGYYAKSFITHYDSAASKWVTTNVAGSSVTVNGINADGTVMCNSTQSWTGSSFYAAKVSEYDAGTDTWIETALAGTDGQGLTSANEISPNGEIVLGVKGGVNTVWKKVSGTWTEIVFTDLMSAEDQALWTGITLTGVNDSGHIVGYGTYNGQSTTSGFVMIPEPATVSLLSLGALGLIKSRK